MLAHPSPTVDAVIPYVRRGRMLTDREKAGFRGSVQTCSEEEICPATRHHGEVRNYATAEYASDGRFLSWRSQSGGVEWSTSYLYDAENRIVKAIAGKVNESATDSVFTYDEAGRLLTITDSPQKGCRVDFQYEAEGRKTAIQTFDPETIRRGQKTIVAGSPRYAAVSGIGVLLGGMVKTTYNDKGLASEIVVLGSEGQLIKRFVCTYDSNGQIATEESIFENPAQQLLSQMLADRKGPPLTPDQIQQMEQAINEKIRKGPNAELFSGLYTQSYTYDARGRTTTISGQHNITTMLYNDQGDQIEWRENRTFARPNIPASNPGRQGCALPVSLDNIVHYSYQYDSHGNWTQRTQTFVIGPGFPDELGPIVNRQLTYY